MVSSDRTVRVFISSTFRDMHAERDHLVTVVFPELRERLEKLGLELYDVDLRWGVPALTSDGEKANPWEYCRKWIDQVEPFFVCMLGERYGWVPAKGEIADSRCYAEHRGKSVTEMEIRHAVPELHPVPRGDSCEDHGCYRRRSKHTFFYFRGVKVPHSVSPSLRRKYLERPRKQEKLTRLKEEIRNSHHVRDYDCRWSGSGFEELEAFGKLVLEDLWSAILRDPRYVAREAWWRALGHDPDRDPLYTGRDKTLSEAVWAQVVEHAKPVPLDPLDAEAERMRAFAGTRLPLGRVYGRSRELKRLKAFVADLPPGSSRLMVVTGAPGQGKSALLAQLSLDLAASGHLVVTHFVGATEASTDLRSTLERLVRELDRNGVSPPEVSGAGLEAEAIKAARDAAKAVLNDTESLKKRLAELMGSYQGSRRIVLIVDAVNQFIRGHDLSWLPESVGPNVRIILSCISEPNPAAGSSEAKTLAAAAARGDGPTRLSLPGIGAGSIRGIVKDYLGEYCRELDPQDLETICRMKQARNPLYLFVMLHELRTHGGDKIHLKVSDIIRQCAEKRPDAVSLFLWVLERLERVAGKREVRLWFSYLYLGRIGMSSRELRNLLALKAGDKGEVAALRIERASRRYLLKRGEQWDFFHAQMREAVRKKWPLKHPVNDHRDIAACFRDKWQRHDSHCLSELPYHLIAGREWGAVTALLTDLRFVEAKCTAGMTYQLIADYELALERLPVHHGHLRKKRAQQERIRRWSAEMIGYAAAWHDRRERTARGEVVKEPEPEYPRPLPAAKPSQRQIASVPAHPASSPSRSADLAAFARFVKAEASPLQAHARQPGFVPPHAYNYLPAGPVRVAASSLLEQPSSLWLERIWPETGHVSPTTPLVASYDTYGKKLLAVTADCRKVIFSNGHQLEICDAETGKVRRSIPGAEGVRLLKTTLDGRRAVSLSDDNALALWDLEEGVLLDSFRLQVRLEEQILSVTPDGMRALALGYDQNLYAFDLGRGSCEAVAADTWPKAASITADGNRAVAVESDGRLTVWDLRTNTSISRHVLDFLSGRLTSPLLDVSADGRTVVYGSQQSLMILDLQQESTETISDDKCKDAYLVRMAADARRAVTAGGNDLVVWDLERGCCVSRFWSGDIQGLWINPDGSRAVSAGLHDLSVWDLELSPGSGSSTSHEDGILGIRCLSRRSQVVSSSFKELRIWSTEAAACIAKYQVDSFATFIRALHTTRPGIVKRHARARLWGVEGRHVATLEGSPALTKRVGLTDDSRYAYVAIADYDPVGGGGTLTPDVRVLELATGELLRTLHHEADVASVSVSATGRVVTVCGSTLAVWHHLTGKCLRRIVHSQPISMASVTANGKRAVSLTGDRVLHLWDLQTGECLGTHDTGGYYFGTLAVLPDGRHAASTGHDQTVRVWSFQQGGTQALFHSLAHPVPIAPVSPTLIACGTASGEVIFLRIHHAEASPDPALQA